MAMPISKARSLQRFFFSGAAEMEPDKQGRILIPSVLREYAGIEKDAVLVGMGSHLEIWSKDRWLGANSFDDIEEIAESMEGFGI